MDDIKKLNLSGSPLLKNGGDNPLLTVFLYILVGVVAAVLVFVSFVGLCGVNQNSMMPTLADGDRVLVFKYPGSVQAGDIVTINTGERIQARNKDGTVKTDKRGLPVIIDFILIKRVVATGGDEIKFVLDLSESELPIGGDSSIPINTKVLLYRKPKGAAAFELVHEPYARLMLYSSKDGNNNIISLFKKIPFDENGESLIKIPENYFYAMGDNRPNSNDSREYGAFSDNKINSKVFYHLKRGSLTEWFFKLIYSDL